MSNVMLLFGSGGHSTEMLSLIQNAKIVDKLNRGRLHKVVCVVSEDDELIIDKIEKEFTNCWKQSDNNVNGGLEIVRLRRGRKVGQSYVTAIWTTLIGILHSISIVMTQKPSLCITNGPAISVTISFAIRCLQLFTFGLNYKCSIIYIESFCRTQTLSLSGKLIYHLRLTNEFYVQWPCLNTLYPRAKYKGILV